MRHQSWKTSTSTTVHNTSNRLPKTARERTRNDKPSSLGGAAARAASSHCATTGRKAKAPPPRGRPQKAAARAHSLCCSPKEQVRLPIRGMDRVSTRSTSRSHRAAAPSAPGMNEPLNAPLGSVEDELRFALGGDVDVQLFDGDIDEALRSAAAGGDDDGSVADPFASRPGSPLDPHGAGDRGSSPLGFPHRDPFQSDERYGHAAPAAAASDGPYLGLSRLVSMPGDDGCDGPTYVAPQRPAPPAGGTTWTP
ncbi:hypothetical protein THAOC_32721, partial [Thalassiosira oceanica]